MKKLFSFLAIIAIIMVSNCTRIPENNDPVIGVWSNEVITSVSTTDKQTIRKEWIFNDAYLGRYHSYSNQNLELINDFRWTQEDGTYTITYPGTDLPVNIVTMEESPEGTLLQDNKGNILAKRE